DRRDVGRSLTDGVALERGVVEFRGVERFRDGDGCFHIVETVAALEHGFGHRAIDEPGVEMRQAVMRGKLPGERALAGGSRPVDGNDHRGGSVRRARATPSPPPLAGEGQGGGIHDELRKVAPTPTLPRKRGREQIRRVERLYIISPSLDIAII